MTLDEGHLSARELLLRDRERDWADRKADWDEQRLVESVEAVEAFWDGAMAAGAAHYSATQSWDGT